MHGYALGIRLDFEAHSLDAHNWVVDFGGMKDFKDFLQQAFDHKTVIALDDPEAAYFREGHQRGVMDVVMVRNTGCEAFAKLVYDGAVDWLRKYEQGTRVRVARVEVFEHEGNSAIYLAPSDSEVPTK